MPFVAETFVKRFSDLVVHELDPSVGYSRRDLNITPPAQPVRQWTGLPDRHSGLLLLPAA